MELNPGEVLTTQHLRDLGHTETKIAQLVRSGVLVRVWRGHYLVGRHNLADAAALTGGSLTCVDALASRGIWTPMGNKRVHLRFTRRQLERREATIRSLAPGAVIHSSRYLSQVATTSVDRIGVAIVAASSCLHRNELVAVIESAVRAGVTWDEAQTLREAGIAKLNEALSLVQCDATGVASMSGAETLMRLALRAARIKFRQQVPIRGYLGDFVIGDVLVVEVDGLQYHGSQASLRHDRLRDRVMVIEGLVVLRFTALEVYRNVDACIHEIKLVMRRGAHLRRKAA